LNKVLDGTFGETNYSIFKYQGVIKKAIVAIKYKFATDIVDELVDASVERLKSRKLHNVAFVPIPLHIHRSNWRGFNQSEIIGKKIAEKLNWEFVPDLLIRNKNTTPQVGLKSFDRHQNMSGVFSVSSRYIQYSKPNILIFDDVYTTGSTMKEAKKVLKNSGFKRIYSLTIAR